MMTVTAAAAAGAAAANLKAAACGVTVLDASGGHVCPAPGWAATGQSSGAGVTDYGKDSVCRSAAQAGPSSRGPAAWLLGPKHENERSLNFRPNLQALNILF
jgi:hypothetical protein